MLKPRIIRFFSVYSYYELYREPREIISKNRVNRYCGCFFTSLSPFSSFLFFLPSFHPPFPFGFSRFLLFAHQFLFEGGAISRESHKRADFLLIASERSSVKPMQAASAWQNPHWINKFVFPLFRLHASFNFDARMRDFVGSCRWNVSLGMMRK